MVIILISFSRKQRLGEALVDVIVKDGQIFSVVEDEVFRNFVNIQDSTYILGLERH